MFNRFAMAKWLVQVEAEVEVGVEVEVVGVACSTEM